MDISGKYIKVSKQEYINSYARKIEVGTPIIPKLMYAYYNHIDVYLLYPH